MTPDGKGLDWIRAHDGDFFPETIEDYAQRIRHPGADGSPTAPVRIDIDITQHCNNDCSFCFSRHYQDSGYKNALLNASELVDMLDSCSRNGTVTARFCGGGEPLTHPEIRTVLSLPSRFGLRSCLITNGDLLDEKLAEDIIANVDHLRWSVNAASDKTRRLIHRPDRPSASLSATRRIIRQIADSTEGASLDGRTMIWATYLVQPDNLDEVEDAACLLRETGVNSVSFRPIFHGLYRPWTDDEMKRLEELLLRARSLSRPPRFNVFVPKQDIRTAFSRKPDDHFDMCRSRTQRSVIEAHDDGGRLQPCGLYRGRADTATTLIPGRSDLESAWRDHCKNPQPQDAPHACPSCIDISMNLVLEFMSRIFEIEPDARIFRAQTVDLA